jgi:hypothetical protein
MKVLAVIILILAVLGSLLGLGWSLGGFLEGASGFPSMTDYSALWGSLPPFPTSTTYSTTLQAFQGFLDFLWGVLANVGKTIFYFVYDIVNVFVYILNFENWGFING